MTNKPDLTGTAPVALVTGSSRGIGLAIAEHLADAGFCVVINGRTQSPAFVDAEKALAAKGGMVLSLPFDISDIAGHDAMLQVIIAKFGRLDCLVNNAGISVKFRGALLEVASPSFDLQ